MSSSQILWAPAASNSLASADQQQVGSSSKGLYLSSPYQPCRLTLPPQTNQRRSKTSQRNLTNERRERSKGEDKVLRVEGHSSTWLIPILVSKQASLGRGQSGGSNGPAQRENDGRRDPASQTFGTPPGPASKARDLYRCARLANDI